MIEDSFYYLEDTKHSWTPSYVLIIVSEYFYCLNPLIVSYTTVYESGTMTNASSKQDSIQNQKITTVIFVFNFSDSILNIFF